MVDCLYGKASDRKLRLLGCACCRKAWSIYSQVAQHAVEMAERFADGLATKSECRDAENALANAAHVNGPRELVNNSAYRAAASVPRKVAWDYASVVLTHPAYPFRGPKYERFCRERDALIAKESNEHLDLLRDIFGNPFRPVMFDSNWRTTTAIQLAQHMYDSRDFSAMPILADALQDAGCDKADILDHCRRPGPHVRGCWVVDLVLGKA